MHSDARPVTSHPYRSPHDFQAEINRQVDKLLDQNIVEPCDDGILVLSSTASFKTRQQQKGLCWILEKWTHSLMSSFKKSPSAGMSRSDRDRPAQVL